MKKNRPASIWVKDDPQNATKKPPVEVNTNEWMEIFFNCKIENSNDRFLNSLLLILWKKKKRKKKNVMNEQM